MRLRCACATQVTANADISCVFITRIKQNSTNVCIGDDATATYRIQNCQGRRAGRSKEEGTGLYSNKTVVIVLWRNGDRADRPEGSERSLANNCVSNPFVGRPVKTICAKIVRVGVPRTQRHRRVEKDRISAVNVVCRNTVATEEAPIAVKCSGNSVNPGKTNEVIGLIKVGVIHRHVGQVRSILIDVSKATVPEIDPIPCCPGRKQIVGPVILGSTNGKIRIRGVHGYAHELSCSKSSVIETGPVGAAVD